MLAICEDCAKLYNIDESRIKGVNARFSCYECGHIIVVKKPKVVEPSPEAAAVPEEPETRTMTDEEAMAYLATLDAPEGAENNSGSTTSVNNSGSAGSVLTITLIFAALAACGVIAYIYLQ